MNNTASVLDQNGYLRASSNNVFLKTNNQREGSFIDT